MAYRRIGDRIKCTSPIIGTGSFELAPPPTGFQSFAAVFDSGQTDIPYLAVDSVSNPTQWEVGYGTLTEGSPDTLSRDTVHSSSSGGSKVSFIAGCVIVNCPTAQYFLDTPALSGANIWTASQTIQSTDSGAGTGPSLTLDRNSSSPAANDILGVLGFYGRDGAGNSTQFAYVLSQIIDPTNASEDGQLHFGTMIGGTVTTRFALGNGFFAAGQSDPGAGAVNATSYQKSGTALPLQTAFESAEQTITVSTQLTLAHSLGAIPKLMQLVLRCKTTEGGHAVGDELAVHYDTGNNRGIQVSADATNLFVTTGGALHQIINKSTGATVTITAANWRIVARAWV